jgi:HPt (histidine-containing phosphotransfer) domain-containing protein
MSMTEPADIPRIRQFADGLPGGFPDFVALFMSHALETASLLREAAARGDGDEIRAVAHRFCGAAGACGADRLLELLRDAEAAAAAPDSASAAALVAGVQEEVERVNAYLAAVVEREREAS